MNQSEELFYQLQGRIEVVIMDGGKRRSILIGPGEMFLLPPAVPHSPRRPADSVGLVIELYREKKIEDGFQWFCEKCDHKLYEEFFHVEDIVRQLPPVFTRYWADEKNSLCSQCGHKHLQSNKMPVTNPK